MYMAYNFNHRNEAVQDLLHSRKPHIQKYDVT